MQAVKRLSTALQGPASQTSQPTAQSLLATPALATFLTEAKRKFIEDSSTNAAREWTVSMGNEAGDLDTIASSIGFAWLQSTVNKKPTVPFMQFKRADIVLRNENIYALELAGIKAEGAELFCANDNPSANLQSTKFALVDHNRLGSAFLRNNANAQVIAVVDHHDDEGLYTDTADPRIVKSAGSCASHIALLCPKDIPAELATLLLCAVVIDTNGLKPGGKAEDLDRRAAAFLFKRSIYAQSTSTTDSPSQGVDPSSTPEDGSTVHTLPIIKSLASTLALKKEDVHNLSAADLIRRDYKQYALVPAWEPKVATLNAGLSTVPRKLKEWIGVGGKSVAEAGIAWMEANELSVLGIVTSFREKTVAEHLHLTKEIKGKSKREILLLVRSPASLDVEAIAARVFAGFEGASELRLTRHPKLDNQKALGGALPNDVRYRVYKQGNAGLSRKFVGPLLTRVLEGTAGPGEAGTQSVTAATAGA